MYLKPAVKGDFRCFLSTATGFGTVGVKNGKPFAEVVSSQILYREIKYRVPTRTADQEESEPGSRLQLHPMAATEDYFGWASLIFVRNLFS